MRAEGRRGAACGERRWKDYTIYPDNTCVTLFATIKRFIILRQRKVYADVV